MIVMTIFGAIGVFVRFWYRYDERMTQHEAEPRPRSPPHRQQLGERSA